LKIGLDRYDLDAYILLMDPIAALEQLCKEKKRKSERRNFVCEEMICISIEPSTFGYTTMKNWSCFSKVPSLKE